MAKKLRMLLAAAACLAMQACGGFDGVIPEARESVPVLVMPEGYLTALQRAPLEGAIAEVNRRVEGLPQPRRAVVTPDCRGVLAMGGGGVILWWPELWRQSEPMELRGEVRGFSSPASVVVVMAGGEVVSVDSAGTRTVLPNDTWRLRFVGARWVAIAMDGSGYGGLAADGVRFEDQTRIASVSGARELATARSGARAVIDGDSGLVLVDLVDRSIVRRVEGEMLWPVFRDDVAVTSGGRVRGLNLVTGKVDAPAEWTNGSPRFMGWRELGARDGGVAVWLTGRAQATGPDFVSFAALWFGAAMEGGAGAGEAAK